MRYLLITLPTLLANTVAPVASLRVDGERSTFSVVVRESANTGYNIEIKCAATCSRPIAFNEAIVDTPMGLFSRDQDDLVFSLWSSGSTYRVRVWQISDAGIREVAELPSRGRPDFLTDGAGRSAIRTYEGGAGVKPLKAVLWSFINDRFVAAP